MITVRNYQTSQNKYYRAESKELEEIESPDENTSIVVLNNDGSHVHLDTHAKIRSKEGNIDRHDTMQLFKKMKNESNVVTDYVIDDKLNVFQLQRI